MPELACHEVERLATLDAAEAPDELVDAAARHLERCARCRAAAAGASAVDAVVAAGLDAAIALAARGLFEPVANDDAPSAVPAAPTPAPARSPVARPSPASTGTGTGVAAAAAAIAMVAAAGWLLVTAGAITPATSTGPRRPSPPRLARASDAALPDLIAEVVALARGSEIDRVLVRAGPAPGSSAEVRPEVVVVAIGGGETASEAGDRIETVLLRAARDGRFVGLEFDRADDRIQYVFH